MAASAGPSDAVKNFVPCRPDNYLQGREENAYQFVDLHDHIEALPSIVKEAVDVGSFKFRADKDIEFIGFELLGLDPNAIELTEDQNKSSTICAMRNSTPEFFQPMASYKITGGNRFEHKAKAKIGSAQACQSKEYAIPLPESLALEANKWYKIDFKIKGPSFLRGKKLKSTTSVNVGSCGTVNFVFKRGTNTNKIATIMFNVLGDKEPARVVPASGKSLKREIFIAPIYETFRFYKDEKEENGVLKFKVSIPVEIWGIRLCGVKSEEKTSGDKIGISVHRTHMEIHNATTGTEIYHGGHYVLTTTDKQDTISICTCEAVKLEPDVVYQLAFTITGPKRRHGMNLRPSVTIRDDEDDDEDEERKNREVTFTYLDGKDCRQLQGIEFRFMPTAAQLKIEKFGQELEDFAVAMSKTTKHKKKRGEDSDSSDSSFEVTDTEKMCKPQ